MRIETAIAEVHGTSNAWISVTQIQWTSCLELNVTIRHEKRRQQILVVGPCFCDGVHEFHISDLDSGGIALYRGSHPVALQYTARSATLSWTNRAETDRLLGALYRAHVDAVDDWLPFDRYAFGPWTTQTLKKKSLVLKGPDFLMRRYAKALRDIGESPRLALVGSRSEKDHRPKILHFGESFVVADKFRAERISIF